MAIRNKALINALAVLMRVLSFELTFLRLDNLVSFVVL